MSAEHALLAAIRQHAAADADVKAALGDPARLFDQHPKHPVFPFVTLGRVETVEADAADAPAFAHTVTFHIWSREAGKAEALAAVSALRNALHDASITLSGWRLVLLRAGAASVALAGDARGVQGVLTLNAITEPA
jgi:hypothetical protein